MKTIFCSVTWNGYQNSFWQTLSEDLDPAGQFYIDIARRLNPNRLISRCSAEWSIPFEQQVWPGMVMPAYDSAFNKTFADISEQRALEIKSRINNNNERFAVMYSGGIDSTVIMTALLKNLTQREKKNLVICASAASAVNNPVFWTKFIAGKLTVIDSISTKYDDLIEQGLIPITGDTGDCLFGTTFASHLYYNWRSYTGNLSSLSANELEKKIQYFTSPEIHYSEFKDLLINYFKIPKKQGFPFYPLERPNPAFAEIFYNKLDLHAQTSPVEIRSLHDFFWWYIFNLKYVNCAVRGHIYYNDRIGIRQANDTIVNWYHTTDYQQWSMANNNNGTKIGLTAATYKKVARDYIFDFDRNPWYQHFKLKIENVGLMFNKQAVEHLPVPERPNARFGVTNDYQLLSIDQPGVQEYIRKSLVNYKIDWQ
jgi:hypothetical protein